MKKQRTNLSWDEIEHEVESTLDKSLELGAWKRLHVQREELLRIGAIQSQSTSELRDLVGRIFRDYRERDTYTTVDPVRKDEIYQQTAEMLCLSGIAQASTWTDWQIARVHSAEESLGIRSFEELEIVVAEAMAHPKDPTTTRRGRCRHLHKGPGNGLLMYKLRKGRKDRWSPKPQPHERALDVVYGGTEHAAQRSDVWQEIGVGDRMYFSIERLLERFVRPECKEDPATLAIIRALSIGLQDGLRNHWFDEVRPVESMTPTLKPKRRVDLNDIITFLAEPEGWLKKEGQLYQRGKYTESKEFPRDTEARLQSGSDEWLMEYAGIPVTFSGLSERIGSSLRKITDVQTQLNPRLNVGQEAEKEWYRILALVRVRHRLPSVEAANARELREALTVTRDDLHQLRRDLRKQPNAGSPDGTTSGEAAPHPEHTFDERLRLLEQIFDEHLVGAIRNCHAYEGEDYRKNGVPLDLNRAGPEMYLHNFVPGEFVDMPDRFPPNSFLLITATRSDSHDTNDEFIEDICGNLGLLEPGGLLRVDGIRQSGSRLYRFREAEVALDEAKGNFQAMIAMCSRTHEPRSLHIQKRHPTKPNGGYFSAQQLERMNGDDIYLTSLHGIENRRPNLGIINEIRRRIIGIADGDLTIFNQLHGRTETELNRYMIHAAIGRYASFIEGTVDQSFVDDVQELLRKAAGKNKNLGTRLDKKLAFDHQFAWNTFFEIRDRLINGFGAGNSVDVRREYEQAIFQALSERLAALNMGWSPGERIGKDGMAEWRERLLEDACNVQQDDIPLLRPIDIGQITSEVAHALREYVVAKEEKRPDIAVIGGLDQLSHADIHALPRHNAVRTDTNDHFQLPISRLPNNAQFESHELVQSYQQKTIKLLRLLNQIYGMKGEAPILVVRFSDCATNMCLLERLREILGEDYAKYVESIRVDFDPGGKTLIRHLDGVLEKLRYRMTVPTIATVGGSWFDAHDEYGAFYKEHVGRPIVEAIMKPHTPVRMFNLCFGYQTAADLLGEKLGMGSMKTEAGALEFCPSAVRVEEQEHPLFRNCPRRFSAMQTHSGHVHGLRMHTSNSSAVRVIALSELTNLPVAFSAYDDKIIGFQGHPEVRIKSADDRRALITELSKIDETLSATFGATSKDIDGMWQRAAEPIRAEAGPHLIVNGLLHHAESLMRKSVR